MRRFVPNVAALKEGAKEQAGKKDPRRLLIDEEASEEADLRAEESWGRYKDVVRLISFQNNIVAGLLVLIFLAMPVLRPIYKYNAIRPDGAKMAMSSMLVPNLTDQSVLSWSAKSITELMTFGFGDIEKRIFSQKQKFTTAGWEGFIKGFLKKGIWEAFKSNQLVLMTAPSDLPVIVKQGPDLDGVYKWIVEMPIVMKYSTNDMKSTVNKGIVRITLVRVPLTQNPDGIGIDEWMVL